MRAKVFKSCRPTRVFVVADSTPGPRTKASGIDGCTGAMRIDRATSRLSYLAAMLELLGRTKCAGQETSPLRDSEARRATSGLR